MNVETQVLTNVGVNESVVVSVDASDISSDIERLDDKILRKVFVKDMQLSGYEQGKYSDLSVIKLTDSEYERMVANDQIPAQPALYVLCSDAINAYGSRIRNVGNPEESSDAVSKGYVDSALSSSLSAVPSVEYVDARISSKLSCSADKAYVDAAISACLSGSTITINDISGIIQAIQLIGARLGANVVIGS